MILFSSTLVFADASDSVSSVNTLEEVKVAKGCLYVQVPVQEVRNAFPISNV